MFEHLFSSIQIGQCQIRNRIVSPPQATRFGKDGYITEQYTRYHEEKAKGGAGLVQCFGSMSVHPTSPIADSGLIKNWDDSSLPTFESFARAIKSHDAHVMAQITHRGRRASSAASEMPLLSPSDIPEQESREIPHALDEEMIAEIVSAFAAAALRLKRAGFDGVDLPGFYRHLIDQFWVPSVNRRTDRYGGSLENRLRFAIEVITAIRAAVGRDFIVGMRVSGDEMIDGGLHLEEMIEIIGRLNALKQLDYFTVTGSTGETARTHEMLMPYGDQAPARFAPLAARIRTVVDIPIIYAGGVINPHVADRLIAEGVCDLVAMARALIADPYLPKKAQEGRLDAIRPCVGMQEGCVGRTRRGLTLTCAHNPVTGREAELSEIVPATRRKTVVVVGGGPAGLEAARVAALRGHRVTLFERGTELGGQVLVAGRAPLLPYLIASVRWLARQLSPLDVTIALNVEATSELIASHAPDAVIVATGATPRRPELPGAQLPNVATVEDVLMGRALVGKRCVVIDNLGTVQAGMAADFLAQQGRDVTVITPYHTVCDATAPSTKEPLYERLYRRNVTMIVDTMFRGVQAGPADGELSLFLYNEYAGRHWTKDGADTVVLSYGTRADDRLYRELIGKVSEVLLVGDAQAPRTLHDAILEGTRAARKI